MHHLMIDIESFGTTPPAAIASIGAVYFDPDTGKLGDEFHMHVNLDSALTHGRVDGPTIEWWMSQSDVARRSLFQGVRHSLPQVLRDLTNFIHAGPGIDHVTPWGNGASFDITMIELACHRTAMPLPWKFWNILDVRTIVRLADGIVDRPAHHGIAHNALEDAKHQARYVSAMWQALRSPHMSEEISKTSSQNKEVVRKSDAEEISDNFDDMI